MKQETLFINTPYYGSLPSSVRSGCDSSALRRVTESTMMELPPIDSEAFLDLPALPPPEGVTPNFVDPPNLCNQGLNIVQCVLVTTAVLMRLYTKRFILKKMLAEDCTLATYVYMLNEVLIDCSGWLLAAWVCFTCFQANIFILEDLPVGVHQWDMTMRNLIRFSKVRRNLCKIHTLSGRGR